VPVTRAELSRKNRGLLLWVVLGNHRNLFAYKYSSRAFPEVGGISVVNRTRRLGWKVAQQLLVAGLGAKKR